jgi:16S rRNA G966 N2-methylase RsmD
MEKKKQRIDVKIDHGSQAFYTDNVTVLHSPNKFIVDFSQTVPRVDNIDGKMRQTFTIKHDTVIMDPPFAKMLLDILKKNVKAFEKKFGGIKLPKKMSKKKKPIEAESTTRYIG